MTREEIAIRLFEAIESACPDLVHYFNPYFEDYYDSAFVDLHELIIEVCKPWSAELAERGEYSPLPDISQQLNGQKLYDLLSTSRRK